jgi:hypothetical protein
MVVRMYVAGDLAPYLGNQVTVLPPPQVDAPQAPL